MTPETHPRTLMLACAGFIALSTASLGTGFPPRSTQPRVLVQDPVPTLAEIGAHLQAQRLNEAVTALEAYVEANPESAQGHFLLGFAVHGTGDYARAAELHRKAAKYPAFQATALYNLACAESRLGSHERAMEALRKAHAAGFNNNAQVQSDADLAELRATEAFRSFWGERGGGSPPAPLVFPEAKRWFDFMVGEWDITSGGVPTGSATVEWDLQSQTLVDRRPGQSTSYLTFIEREALWRQTWMSVRGHHDLLEGGMEDGRLVMHQPLLRDQPGRIGRSIFTDIGPDQFRTHWEVSVDEGATWARQFSSLHTRRTPRKPKPEFTLAGMSEDAPKETHGYAFKLGRWDIKARALGPGGGYRTGVGTSLVRFADDGATLLDDITCNFMDWSGFQGQTRRRYSTEDGHWVCSWNPAGGAPVEFTATEDPATEQVVESFRGQDAQGSFRGVLSFEAVTEDSYHAKLEHHYDGGPVVVTWEYVATRLP